jgi:hypothetical protein
MMLVAPSASAQASSDPSPFRVPPEPALPAPFPNVGRPEPSRKTPGPLYIAEQPGTVLLVTEYLGRPVHGPDKQKVGTISNLLVDISGRVTGFVIDVGGFLGIGAKEVAIAFDALYPVAEDGREAFLVEMKKEQLAAAPSFKRSR